MVLTVPKEALLKSEARLKQTRAEKQRKPDATHLEREHCAEMGRQVAAVPYVVAMAAAIVGVDVGFLRHRFWERLTVNIGLVLVFVAFYWRFLRRR